MEHKYPNRKHNAQILLDYLSYSKEGMNHIFENMRNIMSDLFGKTPDQILTFLIIRAKKCIIMEHVFEICEIWTQVNEESAFCNLPVLDDSEGSFKELKRLRDKVFAHHIENLCLDSSHMNWYYKTYSHYDRIVELIFKINLTICNRIEYLDNNNLLATKEKYCNKTHKFTQEEIVSFREKLRNENINK